MLEPTEATAAYAELSKLALAHGLDWLIADVEVQIALGKQGTTDMKVTETVISSRKNSSPQRRGRKASFVVIQPFTEREKLRLLIEALEATSVGLSLGILETYGTIRQFIHGLQAIGFAPDVDGAQVTSVGPKILENKESILRLGTLLRELKESV
jgi:hypothetical protein